MNTPAVPAALLTNLAIAREEAERAQREADAPLPDSLGPNDRKAELERRRQQLDDSRERLKRVADDLQVAFDVELEKAKQALAPMQRQVHELGQMVQTLDRFLGTDEVWGLIIDGEPAPAATPIVVYQDVEYMDEILAIEAERLGIKDGTLDPGGKGWDTFDDWLRESPDNVAKLIPAERGIVCAQSARVNRSRSSDNDGSEVAHFYFRNGNQLSVVISSLDLRVHGRIIPTDSEFDSMFVSRRYNFDSGQDQFTRAKPGSHQWERAKEQMDRRQRHYMDIAVILQGVAERTTALSPLPDGGVNFGQPEDYDAGKVNVVVRDAQLGTGIEPYPAWLNRIQKEARKGHRVIIGNVPTGWGDDDPGYITPTRADAPEPGVYTTKRDNKYRRITYRRTDTVYKHDVDVPGKPGYVYVGLQPTQSTGWAACAIPENHQCDWWLPLDHPDVTAERIEWYLLSRDDRKHYQAMVPLLREAARTLRTETTLEQPFRDLVHSHVPQVTHHMIDVAIRWWKTKNLTHRALLDDDTDSTAFDQVTAKARQLWEVQDLADDPVIVARIRATLPGLMFLGRKPDGTYIALTAADPTQTTFVHIHEWSAVRGKRRPAVEWVLPPDVRLWKQLVHTSAWDNWPPKPHPLPLTGPQTESLIKQCRDAERNALWISPTPWTTNRVWIATLGEPPRLGNKPLTEPDPELQIDLHAYRYELSAGGQLEVTRLNRNDRHQPITRTDRNTNQLWAAADQSELAAERKHWEKHRAIISGLEQQARQIMAQLEKLWVEELTDREYRAFLTKYGAEAKGKWDGHRAIIENQRLQYPHQHNDASKAIRYSVNSIVEHSLAGTLGEVSWRWLATTFEQTNKIHFDGEQSETLATLRQLAIDITPTRQP